MFESEREKRSARPVLAWGGVAIGLGLGLAGYLAWRSVSVQPATASDALRRFSEVRGAFALNEPLLHIDAAGAVTRRAPTDSRAPPPKRFMVLAYRAQAERLVRADLPFWFVRVKGTAAQFLLRDTGLDLGSLGISPAELEHYGPCLILDQTRANGDRLLVWTE
jgi:hypothetical protein